MNGLRLEDFAYHYVEVSPDKLPDIVVHDVYVLILKSASNLNGNLNCSKELEHYAS
jgi:hypothetical protein